MGVYGVEKVRCMVGITKVKKEGRKERKKEREKEGGRREKSVIRKSAHLKITIRNDQSSNLRCIALVTDDPSHLTQHTNVHCFFHVSLSYVESVLLDPQR